MLSESDLGKREIEREHLALFIEAYEEATGETFDLVDCETPDFIGRDRQGRAVGIEVTRFQFDPEDRWMRRTFGGGESFDEDAWWKLLGLLHQKEGKLAKGRWHLCQRKILVVMLIDCPLGEIAASFDTDRPNGSGYNEVWLADCTLVEAFGGVDIFPLSHPTLAGIFPVASRDQKPYG